MRHALLGCAAALGLGAAALWAQPAAADAPDVVASVKPVHALVAAVMAGVGEPTLLVEGAGSPHTYALRPSDARALQDADLVFWVGRALETFLVRPLETLPQDARIVTLAEAPGVRLLETREGGVWGDHDGEHHDEAGHEEGGAEDGHAHGPVDGHIWLDPANARAIVAAAVAALGERDPANADAYAANGRAAVARIDALEAELRARLAPVKDRPYLVFHDAYHYFEDRFGLNAVGSITVSPEAQPGAGRLVALRDAIADLGAACVFSEPQFEPRLVETVVEGLPVGRGVLDPLGAELTPGPDLYAELLTGLADGLVACLGSR